MGRESANFLFIPKQDDACCIDSAFASLGITETTGRDRSPYRYYTYRSARFWIDLQVGNLVGSVNNAISIRIALCNPQDVELAFQQLIEALLLRCGGSLIDRQRGSVYDGTDMDGWRLIQESYRLQKATFITFFGKFEAPLSGDDVFEALQKNE